MAIMKSLTIGNFTGEIPSKTSDLTNDSGFVDAAGAAAAAPVQSVNGKTGDVVLDAADVGALTEADLIALLPVDTASGPIASFPDGAGGIPVEALTVQINPVQDLHGYSNPWPAGGGKNLLPPTLVSGTSITENHVTMTIDGQRFKFTGTASGNGGRLALRTALFTLKAGTYYMSQETSGTFPVPVVHDSTNTIIKQGVGSFTLAGDTSVFVGFNVYNGTAYNASIGIQIESGSTATTYAPYSNLCPISGWSEAKVTRTGSNIWDEEWELGTYSTADGGKVNSSTQIRSKNFIPVKPGQTYYAYCSSNTGAYIKALFYATNDLTSYISTINSFHNNTFTVPSGASYMTFYMNASYGTTYGNDLSINYPSADTTYHAHEPTQTVTIDLSGTRYGGTLDVKTGVLTVTHAIVDLGTLNWTYYTYAGYSGGYTSSLHDEIKQIDGASVPNAVCSELLGLSDNNFGSGGYNNGSCFAINIFGNIKVTYPNVTDSTTLTNALSGVQLAYELATPLSVQLDANTLATLLGTNNVWTSTNGDTSVTYRANIQKYIQKLLGA